MKYSIYLALFMSALLITSCGKESKDTPTGTKNLTTMQTAESYKRLAEINKLSDANPKKAYGVWFGDEKTIPIEGSNLHLKMELGIGKDIVVGIATCTFEKDVMVVEVYSKAIITDTEITVNSPTSRTEKLKTRVGNLDCTISIEQAKATYKRDGDTLTITDHKTKQIMSAKRVR